MEKEIIFQQVLIQKLTINNCENLTQEQLNKQIQSSIHYATKLTYGLGLIEKSDPEVLSINEIRG